MPECRRRLSAIGCAAELTHGQRAVPTSSTPCLEVNEITRAHTFPIDEAMSDFGYTPLLSTTEGLQRCVPYVRELTVNETAGASWKP
jgi:hypothetical protein